LREARAKAKDDTKKKLMSDESIERQMLIKYVTTWNELALAYQCTG
jgi:hypothetical protein